MKSITCMWFIIDRKSGWQALIINQQMEFMWDICDMSISYVDIELLSNICHWLLMPSVVAFNIEFYHICSLTSNFWRLWFSNLNQILYLHLIISWVNMRNSSNILKMLPTKRFWKTYYNNNTTKHVHFIDRRQVLGVHIQLPIYTHRQKLSNSKLVLNINTCFVPNYCKFKFYNLHLTSIE